MITWGDVVEIIVYIFDINQTELAKLIRSNKGVISRIKNGTQTPTVTNEELFSLVFDPDTSGSPASRGRRPPQYWLELLKREIESKFKEVWGAMEDCWDEKNYQEFVLVLLERAEKGPPSKTNILSSAKCDRSSDTSAIVSGSDCNKKQEATIIETPTEQMRKIFEQAVVDYNIAFHICKLPDYLLGESFFCSDIFDFIDTIQASALTKFVNFQCEDIFRHISKFNDIIKSYAGFLGLIRLSVSEKYGFMLTSMGYNNEILGLIDSEYDAIKNNLDREISIAGRGTNDLSVSELKSRLNQLDFLRNIMWSHKQLCELFREICPGKTLLVF